MIRVAVSFRKEGIVLKNRTVGKLVNLYNHKQVHSFILPGFIHSPPPQIKFHDYSIMYSAISITKTCLY